MIYLSLARELREALHRRPTIDHPHLHLEDYTRLVLARRLALTTGEGHRNAAIHGRTHERHFDAATDVVAVWGPEFARQPTTLRPTIHTLGPLCARQLDDGRVEDVNGGGKWDVPVHLAVLRCDFFPFHDVGERRAHFLSGSVDIAQDFIVPHIHRPCKQKVTQLRMSTRGI